MAFLLYFFMLLAMASGVLFGLDWANAPLHAPASQERTQTATSDTQSKAERLSRQRRRAENPSVPIGRPEVAQPAAPEKAETAERQPRQETTGSAPSEPPEAVSSPSVSKSEPVADTRAKPEPTTAQEPQPAAASVSTETPAAVAVANEKTAEKPIEKAQAKRAVPRRLSSRERPERRARAARRDNGAEPVPSWAVQGAEAARRESGRNGQMGEPFRPFWDNENGWHFRW